MSIMDKTEDMRDAVRRSRLEAKLERTQKDLDRLRDENSVLEDRLDRERSAVKQVTEAASEPTPHRVRRLLTLGLAAGGAYVAGSAAGRERYEQIRGWFNRRSDEGWGSPAVIRDKAVGIVDQVGSKAEAVTDRAGSVAKDAASRAGDAAKGAASRVSSTIADNGDATA